LKKLPLDQAPIWLQSAYYDGRNPEEKTIALPIFVGRSKWFPDFEDFKVFTEVNVRKHAHENSIQAS